MRLREPILFGAIALLAIGSPAIAGETVSITLPDVWPTDAAGWGALLWSWVSPYFTVSGVAALLMAILPRGESGSAWDIVRTIINRVLAGNFGNAKNEIK